MCVCVYTRCIYGISICIYYRIISLCFILCRSVSRTLSFSPFFFCCRVGERMILSGFFFFECLICFAHFVNFVCIIIFAVKSDADTSIVVFSLFFLLFFSLVYVYIIIYERERGCLYVCVCARDILILEHNYF